MILRVAIRSAPKASRTTARQRHDACRYAPGRDPAIVLERRIVLDGVGLPFGANWQNNSVFMLGDVAVDVVLLESNGSVDAETEDWDTSRIDQVKAEIVEGLDWWVQTLSTSFSDKHHLEFHVDFSHADQPVPTGYEPINRPQSDQDLWIQDYLNYVQADDVGSYFSDMLNYNNDRRLEAGTDWATTIFVVDSEADQNGKFSDNYFAYAYLGGPFMVMTYDNNGWGISRMSHVTAHEMGHIFYALDEYPGSNSYNSYSGYYNTQNLNANDDHPNPSSRVDSIMAEAQRQMNVWGAYSTSASSAAMMGWQDSDGDGIFDVLDVPLSLSGSGQFDSLSGQYRFQGSASVNTLANQNPRGRGTSAMTINTVDRLEYRLDGGPWQTQATYHAYSTDIDVQFPLDGMGTFNVDLRVVDDETGITSPLFSDTVTIASQVVDGILHLAGTSSADDYTLQSAGNTVTWSDGNDQVLGTFSGITEVAIAMGEGDDRLDASGLSLPITIDGGSGHDTLQGGSGADTILGGSGADSILGNGGSDLLRGQDGNDTLTGGSQADSLSGGPGNDTLKGEGGHDTIRGEDGHDKLVGGDGLDLLDGNKGRDTLKGQAGRDTLVGGADDDTLQGEGGHDYLQGGAGNDRLEAGGGSDTLDGNDGDDTLIGHSGADSLSGHDGRDRIEGGSGRDMISGGSEADTLLGGDGADTIRGDSGNDTLKGHAGDDTLMGNQGHDHLVGGNHHDRLRGGSDRDTLKGGSGHDTLEGGNGNDQLDGGSDADQFIFEGTEASETLDLDLFSSRIRFRINPGTVSNPVTDLATYDLDDAVLLIALGGNDNILLDPLLPVVGTVVGGSGTDSVDQNLEGWTTSEL